MAADTVRWLDRIEEHVAGVGPLVIEHTNIYPDDRDGDGPTPDGQPTHWRYVVREEGLMAALGIGDTLAEALDAFCDYCDRAYPPDLKFAAPTTGAENRGPG